jgi:hypothetical protein
MRRTQAQETTVDVEIVEAQRRQRLERGVQLHHGCGVDVVHAQQDSVVKIQA